MILKVGTPYLARMFLLVQTSDHVTPKTGLGGAVTVYLSRAGAAGVHATNSGAGVTEVDATNLPGIYAINLTAADTPNVGDLTFRCTGTGADPLTFIDQVQAQVFTDLQLNPSGQVLVSSNLKQNAAFTALFLMTQTGSSNPAPGLTITGQRTFGAPGFSLVSGTILEVGGVGNGAGWYVLNGVAADSSAACAGFKMTALGANDSDFTLWFQP